MGLPIRYIHINHLYLDSLFGPINSSEREFASNHIDTYYQNYNDKVIFTFDRGYPSTRLINQLIKTKQNFLFRCPNTFYKRYFNKLKNLEDDCFIEVTFNREETNEYRNDNSFRQYLMSTSFNLRFTKLEIPTSNRSVTTELLLSNLPIDEFDINDLKELYHLRWNIETSYNRLKNRMKLEEFSGYKPVLIYQDICRYLVI